MHMIVFPTVPAAPGPSPGAPAARSSGPTPCLGRRRVEISCAMLYYAMLYYNMIYYNVLGYNELYNKERRRFAQPICLPWAVMFIPLPLLKKVLQTSYWYNTRPANIPDAFLNTWRTIRDRAPPPKKARFVPVNLCRIGP